MTVIMLIQYKMMYKFSYEHNIEHNKSKIRIMYLEILGKQFIWSLTMLL